MSQHDFDIANQTALNARSDINNALVALASNSSGSTAPSNTHANMFWYDTSNNILKMRNEADSVWVNVVGIDQTTGKVQYFNDSEVITSAGAVNGSLGGQATATWEAGTSTTQTLVSPSKVKAAIEALVPAVESFAITSLGTINVTDAQTNPSISGLDLTGYSFVKVMMDFPSGVPFSISGPTAVNLSSTTISSDINSGNFNAKFDIDLSTGYIGGGGVGGGPVGFGGDTSISTSTTTLTFGLTVSNYSAGTIKIYGVK